jgi:transcriptional regulator with XRE-family HTH domain
MNVTHRIEQLLTAKGVSPRSIKPTLRRICDISYQAVSQWFSGETSSIKNEHLVKIAAYYNASLTWLVTGDGEMFGSDPVDQPGFGRKVALATGAPTTAQLPSAASNKNEDEPGDVDEEFGQRVEAAKIHAKMDLRSLSNKIGCTQSFLWHMQRGVRPTENAIIQLAVVCNVSILWLLTGEGSMTTNVEYNYILDGRIDNSYRVFALAEDTETAKTIPRGISLPEQWLKSGFDRTRHLRITQARHAVFGSKLNAGDMVFIDINDRRLANGCVFAIRSALSDTLSLCYFVQKSRDNWMYYDTNEKKEVVAIITNDETMPWIIGRHAGTIAMDYFQAIPL